MDPSHHMRTRQARLGAGGPKGSGGLFPVELEKHGKRRGFWGDIEPPAPQHPSQPGLLNEHSPGLFTLSHPQPVCDPIILRGGACSWTAGGGSGGSGGLLGRNVSSMRIYCYSYLCSASSTAINDCANVTRCQRDRLTTHSSASLSQKERCNGCRRGRLGLVPWPACEHWVLDASVRVRVRMRPLAKGKREEGPSDRAALNSPARLTRLNMLQ